MSQMATRGHAAHQQRRQLGCPYKRRWHALPRAASSQHEPLLHSLRVVLVAPKEPGNVGAAARVCANFEALDLVLVAPRCDPAADIVGRMACGDVVLKRLRVVQELEEALRDTTGEMLCIAGAAEHACHGAGPRPGGRSCGG
jgi:tRNA G18 (ribose-2'-O)-methylase SpoU